MMMGGLFAKTVWALSKGLTSAVRRPTSVCGASRPSSGEPPENTISIGADWSTRRRDWQWPSDHSALGGFCADRADLQKPQTIWYESLSQTH
jgi:hypothetical protein